MLTVCATWEGATDLQRILSERAKTNQFIEYMIDIANAFCTYQGSALGHNYGKNMATGAFFGQAGTLANTVCRSIAFFEAFPAFKSLRRRSRTLFGCSVECLDHMDGKKFFGRRLVAS